MKIINSPAQTARIVGNSKPSIVAISDKLALDTLRDELCGKMSDREINNWTNKVVSICKKLDIEPKQLPINPNMPGNLTQEQNRQFFKEVVLDILA